MSKCWICGKEMTKTIGGCEQCSDCGVGLDDLVFRTRNNSKDNSLDKFVEKYPTYIEALEIIDDLKKQLERHNKYFNSFSCDSFDEFVDFISTFMLTPHEEQTLIKDLKKQLEEKDKILETEKDHHKVGAMFKGVIMEDNELKAIQEAIARQSTNNYPQIFIQDLESGRVFEYGKNCHDRLVISEDGRSLHYANLQNGDGSEFGDYRFYYEKPVIESEMDKAHEFEIDYFARHINNEPLQETQALKDRWQKLKKLLEEDMEHNSKEYNDSFCSAFQHYSATENWVLDRMEELENE